jgi:glucose-6-phosphate isomerase
MQSLERLSGLPIALDDKGRLVFGEDVVVEDHGERLLGALEGVLLEPDRVRDRGEVAYYMDNGVYLRQHAERLAGVPMRYELTLIPPRRVGREYIKTHGHRHLPDPRTGLEPPEICEVLLGTAHFLFQTLDPAGPSATFALCVEVGPGQKVVFPPGFDHCTINPGPEPVLFSDVVALGVRGDYSRFVAARGAAYLEVEEGGRPVFIPNPAYRALPPLRWAQARQYPALRLTDDVPLYTAFVEGRGAGWEFLNDPRAFWEQFPELKADFGLE